jgi:LPS sulfotransferase NodH
MVERPPSNWKPPLLTCLIAASQRSGSSLLGHLMRRTGRLGAPDEYFSPFMRLPPEAPGSLHGFELVARYGTTPNGVAAVKIFPEHLERIEARFRWPEWFPKASWIWLSRDDLLGQAISEAIALQTASWTAKHAVLREPQYSARMIEDSLVRIAEIDSRWRIYFARNAIAPLRLLYEELEASPVAAVGRIADFLGIELEVRGWAAADEPRRQRTQLNDEWRRRYLQESASTVGINIRRPVPRTPRNLARFLRRRLIAGSS